jgi:hypothetical protein
MTLLRLLKWQILPYAAPFLAPQTLEACQERHSSLKHWSSNLYYFPILLYINKPNVQHNQFVYDIQ